jgi:hypothetical protein
MVSRSQGAGALSQVASWVFNMPDRVLLASALCSRVSGQDGGVIRDGNTMTIPENNRSPHYEAPSFRVKDLNVRMLPEIRSLLTRE